MKTSVYSYNSKVYLGHLVKALAQRTNASVACSRQREGQVERRENCQWSPVSSSVACWYSVFMAEILCDSSEVDPYVASFIVLVSISSGCDVVFSPLLQWWHSFKTCPVIVTAITKKSNNFGKFKLYQKVGFSSNLGGLPVFQYWLEKERIPLSKLSHIHQRKVGIWICILCCALRHTHKNSKISCFANLLEQC